MNKKEIKRILEIILAATELERPKSDVNSFNAATHWEMLGVITASDAYDIRKLSANYGHLHFAGGEWQLGQHAGLLITSAFGEMMVLAK